MQYDLLICGGGIHGVHIAARIVGEANIPKQRIGIIDPGEQLLARWRAYTQATGMTHLRSPSVHHLDLSPAALQRFAKRKGRKLPTPFVAPYQRPSLALFNAHCDALIAEYGLDDLHIRDEVVRCELISNGLKLTTQSGQILAAKQIVLAMGSGGKLAWPEHMPVDNPRIQHIFERDFTWPSLDPTSPVLVFGGGISAGQVALRLLKEGHKVHLFARHGMRKHQFDSDPGWLGPKYMAGFQREPCPVRRRHKIKDARHRGSVPGDVQRALQHQIRHGNLYWHQQAVRHWQCEAGQIAAQLSEELTISGQHLLLATGFCSSRPGGKLIDDMIIEMKLDTAPCGFPIVDGSLRWHPNIFVSGPLAELELGPVSRNIAGARRAGDRIVDALRASASQHTKKAS